MNLDTPCGARIFGVDRKKHSYPHSSSDSSPIYPGDFVKTTAGYCTVALAGNRLLGRAANYVAPNVAADVHVYDHPLQEFIIQDDAGATLSQAEVGENCDILATAGDPVLQQSRMELAAASHGTATAQLHLVRAAENIYPDGTVNAVGDHCDWVTVINEHERGAAENVGT